MYNDITSCYPKYISISLMCTDQRIYIFFSPGWLSLVCNNFSHVTMYPNIVLFLYFILYSFYEFL